MRTAFVTVALFIALCIACTIAFDHPRLEAVPAETEAQSLFQQFKAEYEITYESAEQEAQKYAVFQENLKEIVRLNNINNHATFVVNKFADWTKEERKRLSGGRIPDHIEAARAEAKANPKPKPIPAPSDLYPIDWRTMGAVTPVKDQGYCGSCWAFSATECIESAWARAGYGLNILSPQNIIDCANAGNCGGGEPSYGMDGMTAGIDFEYYYPYLATDGHTCYFNGSIPPVGAFTQGSYEVPVGEDQLWDQMLQGPVGVGVDADNIGFFGSGYMDSSNCANSTIDHCVQAVGLTYATDGTPVWMVKNSWNTWWGDQGYFYVAYGQHACEIGLWQYNAIP